MDPGAYNAVLALYKLLLEKKNGVDAVDIAYMTGVMKTLTDLYYEPPPVPDTPPARRKFTDIILGTKEL